MVKKYESLEHICVEGLVLVRSDERERYGKKGTTSKHGDLKQRIACKGHRPIGKDGRYIAVSTFLKERGE